MIQKSKPLLSRLVKSNSMLINCISIEKQHTTPHQPSQQTLTMSKLENIFLLSANEKDQEAGPKLSPPAAAAQLRFVCVTILHLYISF